MDEDLQDAAERFEDIALDRHGNRGGRGPRRGGGRGRGGGGGGGGTSVRQVQISKALSLLLRHQAQSAGIRLDDEGFAPLDRVMIWPRLHNLNPTVAEIREEVASNAKQRFSIKPNPDNAGDADESDAAYWLIRANQGHSIRIASEGLHTPITLAANNIPTVVVHGTYFAFWPDIVAAGGLKRMGRVHVHFATNVPGEDNGSGGGAGPQIHDEGDEAAAEAAKDSGGDGRTTIISGMRYDAELLIFIDVEKALRDSDNGANDGQTEPEEGRIKWWLSENDVVLSEGDADGVVPLKYFKEVRGRRQGVGLLWKDGEKVADLPADVVARVPWGKDRSGRGGRGRGGRGGGGRGGGGRGRGRGRGGGGGGRGRKNGS